MVDNNHMFEFNASEIKSVNIYKSSGDYNYASVTLKRGQAYININYEWQGDITPDFVMDMVAYFGPSKVTASIIDEEVLEFQKRLLESK
jgi:hypothetical protein